MDIQDRLVILDEQGRARIILDATNDPTISIMDQSMNGKIRIGLSANGDMYFNCCADNGSPLLSVGVDAELGINGLYLVTSRGAPSIDISVTESWPSPIIETHDDRDEVTFSLGPHPFRSSPSVENDEK